MKRGTWFFIMILEVFFLPGQESSNYKIVHNTEQILLPVELVVNCELNYFHSWTIPAHAGGKKNH